VFTLETDRLVIREADPKHDAEFMLELLNSPGFLRYIGDRGVRTVADAADFIETRYRQSYRDNGYGLYAVGLRETAEPVGLCGFVRRDTLPGPDLGFAFLPGHEGKGYGFESASAVMSYGRERLSLGEIYAITTLDNKASIRLLEKLGFEFVRVIESPEGEQLNLFAA
jgi:RimJ/RimL family protein N-acetyltransferase